jgi:hypothetical protein
MSGCPYCPADREPQAVFVTFAGYHGFCDRHRVFWALADDAPSSIRRVDRPSGYRDLDRESALRIARAE